MRIAFISRAAQLAVLDHPADEGDRPHLAHERGVEADLVDAVHDVARRGRHVGAVHRVDVDHDHVRRLAVVDQRVDGGVAHVAAVPIGLAVDLDRLRHERQASRRQDGVRRHLGAGEDPDLAGPDVRRRQEQLDRRAAVEPLEIDHRLERLA